MSDIADMRRAVDMAFHPSAFNGDQDAFMIERELDAGCANLWEDIYDCLG